MIQFIRLKIDVYAKSICYCRRPVTISIDRTEKIPQSIDPFPCDPYRIALTYAHILGYYWRGAAGIIVLAESHERCSIVGTSRIILINTEASANDLTWLRIV